MKLTLQRLYQGDDCTIGTMSCGEQFLCYTLELPWKSNREDISCIMCGEYNFKSLMLTNKLELQDVYGRTNILIHAGNTVEDTEGCILVGNKLGTLEGKKAVLNSRKALKEVKEFLDITGYKKIIVRNI